MGKPDRHELDQVQAKELEDCRLELRCKARSGRVVHLVVTHAMAAALAQLLLDHVDPRRPP